jgi:hypothetical protein
MAVLAAFTLLPIALLAQPGGGMRGGSGMHGGFSGHGGFVSRGGMSAGMHSGPASFAGGRHAANRFGGNSFHANSFHASFHHPGEGHHHFHQGVHVHFYSPYGFYGYGYPYYGGYYDPFYWNWNNSSYDQSDDNYVAQRDTTRQIDQLSQEVESLREERDERDAREEQAYSRPVPKPPTASVHPEPAPDATVVLVFLDKRIQEVKNYAIAHEQVVVFDDHHIKKIPLADIDLATTMKLNDERGVDFQVPNPEGTE